MGVVSDRSCLERRASRCRSRRVSSPDTLIYDCSVHTPAFSEEGSITYDDRWRANGKCLASFQENLNEIHAVVAQAWYHLSQVTRPPLREGGLVVGQSGYTRPHCLIRCTYMYNVNYLSNSTCNKFGNENTIGEMEFLPRVRKIRNS